MQKCNIKTHGVPPHARKHQVTGPDSTCVCREPNGQPGGIAQQDARQHASQPVGLAGRSNMAAGSILSMVATINSNLSCQQQITQEQAEALQTVAGDVKMLLGLLALKDIALNDELNDVLESDAKMDSKQILEVRRFLRSVRH